MVDTSEVQAENPSLSAFMSALIFYFFVGLGFFAIFHYFRRRKPRLYTPRDFTALYTRMPDPFIETSVFAWIKHTYNCKEDAVYRVAGPDAAMFMRNLKSTAVMFFGFSILAIGVLIANDEHRGGLAQSLEKLTMSNISNKDSRMWAHIILFCVLVLATIFLTFCDAFHYLGIRNAYLRGPDYRRLLRANSVLVTGIPRADNTAEKLLEKFGHFPGGVMAACPCLTHSDISELVSRRNKHVKELETDMCEFLTKGFRRARHNWKPKELRPTTRIAKFQVARLKEMKDPRGDPVDSIEYHCERIVQLNQEICNLRTNLSMDQRPSSALIVFNRQESAHEACKSSLETRWFRRGIPPTYWPRFSDIDPAEINWEGLKVPMKTKRINKILSRLFVLAIIWLWIFPVVFISAVAKMDRLENFGPFKDISNWPTQLAGLVQGVFPPLILGVLQRFIPDIFRRAIAFEGIPTTRHMELTLLNYMFFFQVTDAFWIPCVASTIFGSYETFLHDPFAAARTIIREIPTVSTFFMAYVLMQALANSGMEIARILHIIDYKFTRWFSKRSPRIYMKHKMPSKFQYAEAIPTHSLMFLLGLIYSAVAPLMTVVTVLYFALFSFVYKYKFMYVYDDRSFRLGGQISIKLLGHRWICLYAAEALFFLVMVIRVSVRKSKASGMQFTMVIGVIMISMYFNYIIKTRIYPRLIYIDDRPEETADVRINLGLGTPEPENQQQQQQQQPGESVQGVQTVSEAAAAMGFQEYALPREIERICTDGSTKITISEDDGSPEPHLPARNSSIQDNNNDGNNSISGNNNISGSDGASDSPPAFSSIGTNVHSMPSMIPTRPDPEVNRLFADARPFSYDAWRIDARPEIATIGPGVPIRSDLFDDPTILWPPQVSDPGYAHVWLPALPSVDICQSPVLDSEPGEQVPEGISGSTLNVRAQDGGGIQLVAQSSPVLMASARRRLARILRSPMGLLGMPFGQMLSASNLADMFARRRWWRWRWPLPWPWKHRSSSSSSSLAGSVRIHSSMESGISFDSQASEYKEEYDAFAEWERITESLYEEIRRRLGDYGDVVTRFSSFDLEGRDFDITAAGYPENPTMRPLQRVVHFE